MKRLPRKRKKYVKKLVAAITAIKTVTAAMAAAMACIQTAIIVSRPIPSFTPPAVTIADKASKAAQVSIDAANAIGKIMSEPPNSWREFIK